MTLITIREQAGAEGANALLRIGNDGEFSITVTDPFSPEEEQRLEWYFEQHLRFPFTGKVPAKKAAESVRAYGEALFQQVFAARDAYSLYREALQDGIERFRFEIAGSPEFHRLHWEALQDPQLPRAFSLETPMVRKNLRPRPQRARSQPSPPSTCWW